MRAETKIAPMAPAELLGDVHPLLEQLGSPEELAVTGAAAAALQYGRVTSEPALRRFLTAYRTQILVPVELPVIVSAYQHALRNELRELVALDTRLADQPGLREFALASCRVGQRQLNKLRPLRDQRIVKRYLETIERGEAHGWHTLVYGLGLATFSLPLRQGLQNYAGQTMRGFIQSAAKSLRLSEAVCDVLVAEQTAEVPRSIELAIPAGAMLRVG